MYDGNQEVNMRVVLYADDMEPITVIELSATAEEFLNKCGMVKLAVRVPPALPLLTEQQAPIVSDWIVRIFSERFVRHGREYRMLFTRDEESALLLKCAFLPGQQARLQEREREAFASGFLYALNRIGNA